MSTTVLPTGLYARANLGSWSHTCSRQAHRHRSFTGDGTIANPNTSINYHRVLNRAVWSSRAVSQVLLQLLISIFAPQGPLVMGLDDTIERRRGEKIKAKGIYRDPVRSSHSHFVKASGLRWLSLM